MPVYEYQCGSCSKRHEIWQKISDAPKRLCPECSGPLHKLISMSSFHLKGGGWYADGYASGKHPKNNKINGEANEKANTGNKPAGASNASASSNVP